MAGSIRLEMFYSQARGNESFSGNTLRKAVKDRSLPFICHQKQLSRCQALSSTTTDALARTEASVDMFPAYSFSVRGVASCCAVRRTAAFCRRADAPGARCSARGFRVSWGAADEQFPSWTRYDLIRLCLNLSASVHALHRCGVILGDLHPGNVMVSDRRHHIL